MTSRRAPALPAWMVVGLLAAGLSDAWPARAELRLPAPLDDSDFVEVSSARVALGRLLFFDPLLSGNRNIACATCHHPRHGTGDAVSLSIGEGGRGLGPERVATTGANAPTRRIGRNAPPLFNLGAHQFTTLFHDGRLERDGVGGFRTPLGEDMVTGFDSVLAAQAMFPVVSGDEMAGHYGENDISRAVGMGLISGPEGAWALIAARVAAVGEYRAMLADAFAVRSAEDVRFTHVANAIAEFIAFEWRATDSPFDAYLRGERGALSPAAERGLALFYGRAGCAGCHRGALLTDHRFHAIGVPQFGPGRSSRFESRAKDTGRLRVTGRAEDAYRFRTPSLRNVAHTAPYGHDGAYPTLEDMVRHHLDPARHLAGYDRSKARLPDLPAAAAADWQTLEDEAETARIAAAIELGPRALDDAEVSDLLAFLQALTDPESLEGRLGPPDRVPSGLAVE